MKQFEYQVSHHPGEVFKQVVYFCSEAGECSIEDVSADQMRILTDILNEKGKQGWELVQVFFGKDGVIALWKRKVKKKEE